MIRLCEIDFAVHCGAAKAVQNRIYTRDRIPVDNGVRIKCTKVNTHALGTIFLLHKENRMVVLGPTGLNPAFCQ